MIILSRPVFLEVIESWDKLVDGVNAEEVTTPEAAIKFEVVIPKSEARVPLESEMLIAFCRYHLL